jgi:KaiC/GvpD/RAD55 family RecA-like ATPase
MVYSYFVVNVPGLDEVLKGGIREGASVLVT